MTLKSMTGYASFEKTLDVGEAHYSWRWDIRSVNGKSADMRLRLPPTFGDLDQRLKKLLPHKFSRGNLQASLSIDVVKDEDDIVVNEKMLAAVLSISKKMTQQHELPALTVDGLLSIKGILESSGNDIDAGEHEILKHAIAESFSEALDQLVVSRKSEGSALERVLEDVLNEIEHLVGKARHAPERSSAAIVAKLKAQVETLSDLESGLDEERLHQEALVMAAKADIKEEIDRLDAHVAAARDLFKVNEPVGRKLDFLSQEFNREANTLCSKANHIAITKIGLALKAAIDQFREQIQNVE